MVRDHGQGRVGARGRRTDAGGRRAVDAPPESAPGPAPARRVAGGVACGAVAIAALVVAPSARAQADAWTSPDKAAHFAMSAPLGALGASLAGSQPPGMPRVLYGTLLGSLPGLAKELADARSPRGDASARDMAVNVVGAAIGAMLADCCLIRPIARNDRLDGVGVEYRIEF